MRALALAKEICQLDPPEGLDRIQSAALQKDRAKFFFFLRSGRRTGTKTTRTESQARCPPASHHIANTLTCPPDGNNHPLWQAATDRKKGDRGKKVRISPTLATPRLRPSSSSAQESPLKPRPCPCAQHLTHSCCRRTWERAAMGINYHRRLFRKILCPTRKTRWATNVHTGELHSSRIRDFAE
jgi:hypothetical protein